jgi:urease gamma subunit
MKKTRLAKQAEDLLLGKDISVGLIATKVMKRIRRGDMPSSIMKDGSVSYAEEDLLDFIIDDTIAQSLEVTDEQEGSDRFFCDVKIEVKKRQKRSMDRKWKKKGHPF